jgi:L-threonylcarbamoyladenylate synthase
MAIISNCTASALKDAAASLMAGNLVAFPTETVYGLGADASNQQAVARIYEVKGRPTDHPLIVHISSIDNLDKWAKDIPEYAIKLARAFWPGPMTLVLKRTDLAKDFITGGQDTVAIRVPSHTLANQLLKEFEFLGGYGVAAPSANRFGKVSPTNSQAVEKELDSFLLENDQILDGGQSQIGIESTIVDCSLENPQLLRPGGITEELIESILEIGLSSNPCKKLTKYSGSFKSHYAPDAKLIFDSQPKPGDGFIALEYFPTPSGVIRLASPKHIEQYANILYESLRLGDSLGVSVIHIMRPPSLGLGRAINDRLFKANGS